jgi:hypothetical protein
MWNSSRRFDQAYTLAKRYYKRKLLSNIPDDIKTKLREFANIPSPWTDHEERRQRVDKIKADIERLLAPVYTLDAY